MPTFTLRQTQSNACTGQYFHTSDFGLTCATKRYVLVREASRRDNARWLDVSLGRFAQADTLVPPGVQGLDRYGYVNNSPVNFTDPSGHDVQCSENGDCYETCDYDCAPQLTHSGDPIPESDKKRRYGGDEIKAIFEEFKSTPEWWNDYGKSEFTIEEFLGLYFLYESNIVGSKERVNDLAEILATITAQNLYVGGFTPAYCSVGGQCDNAVFNFIAANIDGNSGLWGGTSVANDYAQSTGIPKFGTEADLREEISSLGGNAVAPSSVISWNRNKGPSSWGNDQSWAKALIANQICEGNNGLASNSIYYYFDDAIYFSVDQYNYWINHK